MKPNKSMFFLMMMAMCFSSSSEGFKTVRRALTTQAKASGDFSNKTNKTDSTMSSLAPATPIAKNAALSNREVIKKVESEPEKKSADASSDGNNFYNEQNENLVSYARAHTKYLHNKCIEYLTDGINNNNVKTDLPKILYGASIAHFFAYQVAQSITNQKDSISLKGNIDETASTVVSSIKDHMNSFWDEFIEKVGTDQQVRHKIAELASNGEVIQTRIGMLGTRDDGQLTSGITVPAVDDPNKNTLPGELVRMVEKVFLQTGTDVLSLLIDRLEKGFPSESDSAESKKSSPSKPDSKAKSEKSSPSKPAPKAESEKSSPSKPAPKAESEKSSPSKPAPKAEYESDSDSEDEWLRFGVDDE